MSRYQPRFPARARCWSRPTQSASACRKCWSAAEPMPGCRRCRRSPASSSAAPSWRTAPTPPSRRSASRFSSAPAICRSAPAAMPSTSPCRRERHTPCRPVARSRRRRAFRIIRSPITCCTLRRVGLRRNGCSSTPRRVVSAAPRCSWPLIAGLEVIGVAGSEKKTRAILGLSAQHAIDYRSEDVVARVRELTGGRGADLILDPIGGKGFGRNFDMLAPLGMVVSYGRLDGPPDADLLTAMRANSAKSPAVRFFTIHSFDDRPDIRAAAMTVLLDHLAAGRIRPLIHDRLPLAQAGRAQALLESGQVIGKLLLKPC